MRHNNLFLKYGIYIAIALIAYFLIVKLFGLHENPWLRLFNGLIVAYGLYEAIRHKKALQGKEFTYFSGFRTGMLAGAIATGIFTIFMGIYMFHIDTSFPESIMGTWMKGYSQGPGILLFFVIIEGLASTMVLSLTFLQKFKPSRHNKKKELSKI